MKAPDLLYFFFDYVDPACLLLEHRLRHMNEARAPSLVLEPFEIRPPPMPMMDPAEESWRRHWTAMRAEARRLGLGLSEPGIVPWTRKAHELVIHASEENLGGVIHEALFRAYLSEAVDIGRVDVLVKLAADHGLERMTTKSLLDVDRHRETVEAKRSAALDMGIQRVPSLVWRGRMLEGYPDADALRQFLARAEA